LLVQCPMSDVQSQMKPRPKSWTLDARNAIDAIDAMDAINAMNARKAPVFAGAFLLTVSLF